MSLLCGSGPRAQRPDSRSSTSQSPGFSISIWGSLPSLGGCRMGWGKGCEQVLREGHECPPAWAWFSRAPASPLLTPLLAFPVRWKPLCSRSPWTRHPSHRQFWAGHCSKVCCGRAMFIFSQSHCCPRLGGKAGWAGGSEAVVGTEPGALGSPPQPGWGWDHRSSS